MKYKGTVVALGICAASVSCESGADVAPLHCDEPGALVSDIEKRWGEIPVAFAIDVDSRIVILLINPETMSWTMIRAYPGNIMCIDLTGAGWESLFSPTLSPAVVRARLFMR